jgi:hypothetical protein
VETETVDTRERKELFGHTARHVVTHQTDHSPGGCEARPTPR